MVSDFLNLSRVGFQTVEISLISHRRWALLLWGTWAVLESFWYCYFGWSWWRCCCLPFVDGPTKSGLLQLLQESSHCGAELWLTCGARLLLFVWKTPRTAVKNPFLSCCRHVVGVIWAKILRTSALSDPCFTMKITVGAVFNRFLACAKCVSGYLLSSSGVALD